MNDQASECRWMKIFRRLFCGPFESRKNLRRVDGYFVFVFHEGDEVVPDVEDGFHVITALLHARVAVLPAETYQADAAFNAQSRLLQAFGGFGHARSGADGVVDDDHGLIRIDDALDQFARAVLFSLLTN